MRSIGFAIAASLLLTGLAGCSSSKDLSRATTQIGAGVRAAEANLWREARFRFERAVQIEPNNPQARSNLAVAYEGSGDFEKAKENYTIALKLDPGNPHIQKNYSRFSEFHAKYLKAQDGTAANDEKTAPEKKGRKKPQGPPPAPPRPTLVKPQGDF